MSLRLKMNLGFMLTGIVVTFLVGTVLVILITNYENRKVRENLATIAKIATHLIDSEAYIQFKPGDESTKSYRSEVAKLRRLQKDSGVKYVYTFAPLTDQKQQFILDADEKEPAKIGEEYEGTAAMREAFHGRPTYEKEPYTDKWGTFISGYAPIYNSAGKVIGVAGVDMTLQSVQNIQRKLLLFTFWAMIMSIIASVIIAFYITRSITEPLNKIANQLTESSTQIGIVSSQVSVSAEQLAQGSTKQAEAIDKTASTLIESAAILHQNQVDTNQAAQLAGQAKESANKGNDEMKEMIASMEEIRQSSDRIDKIIKIIDDIAFQTNILALNSAIEAARAGEAGAGFATVAKEVRNLAQRSAEAARDSTGIIESNIQLANQGFLVTGKIQEALTEIAARVEKVSALMEGLLIASQEQSQGVTQANQAMIQVGTVTERNVASAKDSASASEQLKSHADSLKEIVRELSQIINGAGRTSDLI